MPLTPEEQHDLEILNAHFGNQPLPAPTANPKNLPIAQTPAGQLTTFDKTVTANVDYAKDNKKQIRDATIDGLEFLDNSKPPTEQSAKDMREVYSSYKTIKDTLSGLRDTYKNYGAELFPVSGAAKEYTTKMGTLTGEIKRLEKLGALDAGVAAYVNSLMTPPVGMNATNAFGFEPQLNEYEKYIDNKIKNTLPTYGYKEKAQTAKEQPVIDYKEFFK